MPPHFAQVLEWQTAKPEQSMSCMRTGRFCNGFSSNFDFIRNCVIQIIVARQNRTQINELRHISICGAALGERLYQRLLQRVFRKTGGRTQSPSGVQESGPS